MLLVHGTGEICPTEAAVHTPWPRGPGDAEPTMGCSAPSEMITYTLLWLLTSEWHEMRWTWSLCCTHSLLCLGPAPIPSGSCLLCSWTGKDAEFSISSFSFCWSAALKMERNNQNKLHLQFKAKYSYRKHQQKWKYHNFCSRMFNLSKPASKFWSFSEAKDNFICLGLKEKRKGKKRDCPAFTETQESIQTQNYMYFTMGSRFAVIHLSAVSDQNSYRFFCHHSIMEKVCLHKDDNYH